MTKKAVQIVLIDADIKYSTAKGSLPPRLFRTPTDGRRSQPYCHYLPPRQGFDYHFDIQNLAPKSDTLTGSSLSTMPGDKLINQGIEFRWPLP